MTSDNTVVRTGNWWVHAYDPDNAEDYPQVIVKHTGHALLLVEMNTDGTFTVGVYNHPDHDPEEWVPVYTGTGLDNT